MAPLSRLQQLQPTIRQQSSAAQPHRPVGGRPPRSRKTNLQKPDDKKKLTVGGRAASKSRPVRYSLSARSLADAPLLAPPRSGRARARLPPAMSRCRRRRRRGGSRGGAPPELRLAYGARARTLGAAVLSLLPPPPPPGEPCPACRGGTAGCLACRRMAHLLRDGDPVAYRGLVTRAVCAVAPAGGAPPPPRYTVGSAGHSQAKVPSPTALLLASSFHFLASLFACIAWFACFCWLSEIAGCLPACCSTSSSFGRQSNPSWRIGRVQRRTSSAVVAVRYQLLLNSTECFVQFD